MNKNIHRCITQSTKEVTEVLCLLSSVYQNPEYEVFTMKSKDIAIVGILLAIGAILRYFLAMLHTLSLIHISEPTRPY